MKKALNITAVILVAFFALLIVLKPDIATSAVLAGIMLCGNVIIPSIYPFTFCVLFIKSSPAMQILKPFDTLTQKLFKLNYYEFTLFLLSLIGGYPLGAKLIKDNKKAPVMINYCINAGPAFIILAIGKGVFKSITVGWILFFSHISASVIIAIICRFFIKNNGPVIIEKPPSAVNNFVISASDAAETLIKICSLIILFSAVTKYIDMFSNYFYFLKYFGLLCEVTTAVFKCRNVLLVSFLLGFSGLSIWCQVFSILKQIKINYLTFILSRISHGGLSALITLLLLKLFKITVSTLSNNIAFDISAFVKGPAVAFSLMIMGIVLIISLYSKKYAGNLLEDMV